MSSHNNTLLLEWARDIQEEFQGTYIEKRLQELIDDNDLEEIKHFISHHSHLLRENEYTDVY